MSRKGKPVETFESLLRAFEFRYDLRSVFDDFLTLALCSFSQNPATGKSHDEDLYLQTIDKYKTDDLRHNFPKMLACLTLEMEEQLGSSDGNDVLGTFYEQNLYRKGASQYFTPWPVCLFLSRCMFAKDDEEYTSPIRILDPTCGSGRMLLTSAQVYGKHHEYYGIDIDHTCVKMTALNLFLNGVFHGEVMWADALRPDDFRLSYRLSFLPFGIFQITEKEKSRLWYLKVSSIETVTKEEPWASEEKLEGLNASQLRMF